MSGNTTNPTRKPEEPSWWRSIKFKDAAKIADIYVDAQDAAIEAIENLAGFSVPNPEFDFSTELKSVVSQDLSSPLGWDKDSTPYPLHLVVYATRAFDTKVLADIVKALAWIEMTSLFVGIDENSPIPLIALIDNLPADAGLQALISAIEASLYNLTPDYQSADFLRDSGTVMLALDLWVKRQVGKGVEEHLAHSDFVVGTAPLLAFQNRFLSRKHVLELTGELNDRRGNQVQKYRARSWIMPPPAIVIKSTDAILKQILESLARRKENAASLLKTHLYLVDQARRQGSTAPVFAVHLDDLLEAKGYKRRADGGFHPDTYRDEWGRLETLASCWLEVRRVTEKNRRGKIESYIDEVPYWHIEARRRLEDGDSLGGDQPVFLSEGFGPLVKSVLIRPGVWWALSDIGSKYLALSRDILALPIDGNGNAKERMAVQIAAVLALWVRASQKTHADTAKTYSVGKLFEAAGIATHDDFFEMDLKTAKRQREHLAGSPGDDTPQGAINILGQVGAFNMSIKDEDDFWASSRGWKERFWEAKLQVQIPNLNVEKAKN